MAREQSQGSGRQGGRFHTAGVFDIRNIIGALLGIYGVVLVLTGLFGSSSTADTQASAETANFWVGIALVVAGVFFLGWARLRPTVVDEAQLQRDKAADDEGSTLDS